MSASVPLGMRVLVCTIVECLCLFLVHSLHFKVTQLELQFGLLYHMSVSLLQGVHNVTIAPSNTHSTMNQRAFCKFQQSWYVYPSC